MTQLIALILCLSFVSVRADMYSDVKNSRNFTGKVVLVTGSTSGIGEATAKLFASLGAKVVVTGRNVTNIRRVSDEATKLSPYGFRPLEVTADVTIENDVQRLINATITQYGQLDVLVNNAGASAKSQIKDNNILELYDSVMRLDLRSYVQIIHLAVPYLEKSKGTIINISSIAGLTPHVGSLTYHLAKSGLEMLTKVVAVELGPSGIRINNINPGIIDTNFAANVGAAYTEEQEKRISNVTPLRRIGHSEDVAKAVVFLASTDSQFVTGASVLVDGGILHNLPANFRETVLNPQHSLQH